MIREQYAKQSNKMLQGPMPTSGTEMLQPEQWNQERALRERMRAGDYEVVKEADRAAEQARTREMAAEMGRREISWKAALKGAAQGRNRATTLVDKMIADYERRIVSTKEAEGLAGLRRLIEELEAALPAALDAITAQRNRDDITTAAANEAAAEADANRDALGMSHRQAYDWLKAHGFELRLRKGVIEIAPKDAATFREKAIVRLHRGELIALLQQMADFGPVY